MSNPNMSEALSRRNFWGKQGTMLLHACAAAKVWSCSFNPDSQLQMLEVY